MYISFIHQEHKKPEFVSGFHDIFPKVLDIEVFFPEEVQTSVNTILSKLFLLPLIPKFTSMKVDNTVMTR